MVFPNQIAAAEEIVFGFRSSEHVNWCILQAQMQSGKTDTFLWVAAEMLMKKEVDHVVVMCGSSETTLRTDMVDQCTNGDSDFWIWMEDNTHSSGAHRREARKNIHVIFGQDFKKFQRPEGKILWIWDESHYAQTKAQRPEVLFKTHGIDPTGGSNRHGDLVLSVSATGFSELIDNDRLVQSKKTVVLDPGQGYHSVESRVEKEQLIYYQPGQRERILQEALGLLTPERNIGVCRVTLTTEKWVRAVCERGGVDVQMFDGDVKEEINDWLGQGSNRVILLKGRCRMGKRMKKDHIAWALETSPNSKSDTILQSLLGRLCGYTASGSSNEQKIYLPRSAKQYIDEYIADGIARNAMNVKKTGTRLHRRTIPDKIILDLSELEGNSQTDLRHLIRDHVTSSEFVSNNEEKHLEWLKAHIVTDRNLRISNLSKPSFKKKGHENRLKVAEETRTVLENPGESCGVLSTGKQIRAWIPDNFSALKSQRTVVVYLQYLSPHKQHELPTTSGKEVFCTPRVETILTQPHGVTLHQLSAKAVSGEEPDILFDEIMELIGEQQEGSDTGSTLIRGQKIEGEIPIKEEDLMKILPGGFIYEMVSQIHKVTLEVVSGPNRTGSYHPQCVKSISW